MTGTVVVSEDDSVITTAETVEVVPLEIPQSQIPQVEIPTQTEIPQTTEPQTVQIPATDENPFRLNTHTYDKIAQVAVSENLQTFQLETLHQSATVGSKTAMKLPQQTVQS